MKIVHTSDIRLGASFVGLKLAGDKIRAALKSVFCDIVEFCRNEKADMLVIAGNLFDSVDISNNLQNFAARQLASLAPMPVVVIPGNRDWANDMAFWRIFLASEPAGNIHVQLDKKRPYVVLPGLDCTVYGAPTAAEDDFLELIKNVGVLQNSKYHVLIGSLAKTNFLNELSDQFRAMLGRFDYIALGGKTSFNDYAMPDIRMIHSGSPERLSFEDDRAGFIVEIDIVAPKTIQFRQIPIGRLDWKCITYEAKEIANNNDLFTRLKTQASPNTLLRLKLKGLALFEAGLEPDYVYGLLENDFLYLDIVDEMIVFPDNVSEVKVAEKTLLGQYLRFMTAKLKQANAQEKMRLEKSIKIGYSLLAGQKIW